MGGTISWQDFNKVEMRVGKLIKVEPLPEARNPSYLLTIDFGPETGLRRSVAALGKDYAAEELMGRLVVAVTNFPAKQIGHRMSRALVLAAVNARGQMRLLMPDGEIEPGSAIR